MEKDIKPLLTIYTIIALAIWIISNNISHNKEIKNYQVALNKEFDEKIEAIINRKAKLSDALVDGVYNLKDPKVLEFLLE